MNALTDFKKISNNCEIHKMQPPSSNDEEFGRLNSLQRHLRVCSLFIVKVIKFRAFEM